MVAAVRKDFADTAAADHTIAVRSKVAEAVHRDSARTIADHKVAEVQVALAREARELEARAAAELGEPVLEVPVLAELIRSVAGELVG